MSATLTKFKALKPDILLISGHSKGAATAARQIEEMKIQAPVIAYTHCEAAKVHEKFPKSAVGVMCPTQWLDNLPKQDKYFGDAAKWNADFKKVHPSYTEVPYQTAQASAAVLVLRMLLSVQIALIRNKFVTLWQQPIWKPSMAIFGFAPEGNNIAKPMFYRQIQADGSYKPICHLQRHGLSAQS